ncbi:hypothetical protein C9374_010691 [Naegleria lovaniensis]|uniref:Non-specific serine/threonine protein kinase n=1 Tax=Naegleria lovaniensis TaxID=51637 RepID=A0AA88KJ02_NAELO|nr:uncharacterized protein C9374_010691 [Naegleria lovaniensis]KAG2374407.1 hypothetical protein C9374_010691 [Naegleria lovaniensis]
MSSHDQHLQAQASSSSSSAGLPAAQTLNFETYLRNFESLKNANDTANLTKLLIELRDHLESASLPECFDFASTMLKPLLEFLNDGVKPKFRKDDKDHLLRQVIIEIIQKLPHTELYEERNGRREELTLLMNSLFKVLKTDNELNGVVAIRLIIDIHKSFKTSLPTIFQPLVDIFLQFYANFEKTIEKYLGRKPKRNNLSTGDAIITEPSDQVYDTKDYLIPCIESCKFMLELPIFIIFFFRSSPLKDTINFTTLFEKVHDIFNYDISVSDDVMASAVGKERVEDFMLLRVKTISFLIYTSKYVDKKNDNVYVKDIPRFVIKCLKECPDECITPRKEMLLIMRHIVEVPLTQNDHLSGICSHFMPYMNDMMNDSVLIGKSRSASETVRSSAYSTVLEILNFNQNKIDFTPTQMSSCTTFCTKLLYDTSLGLGIHALAVGLLVSLSQTIYKNIAAQIQLQQQTSENGSTTEPVSTNISELVNLPHIIKFKEILLSIIRAFVQKVKYLSKLIKKISKKKPVSTEKENANDNAMILPFSPYKFNENFSNDITYCCTMFKHLIFGLKTIVLVFTSVPRDERSKFPELPLLNKLFRYGLDCFDIYNLVSEDQVNVESISKQKVAEEEKDIFNNYSSLYTSLSAPLFTEVFKTQFEYLYKKLLDGRPMTFIHIPANILSSNPNIASVFSEILLKFLLKRMDKIAKDRKESQYMHNLFKLVFGSTVTFPKNETVLKNHMTSIVTSCFTFANKFKECMDYYLILRSLFNSILSAKFDLLCKEFAQLLPTVLEKLSDLVNNAHDKETRNLFVELCLTVPSKLHVLCPYLYLLIKPILYALQPGSSEKATTAALRNLDLWVTSLRNESLEAILKPVIPDLLKALFTHLKPQHHANGATAMRLLAKLGGTHRQYMSELTSVHTKEYANSLFFNINLKGNNNMIEQYDESTMIPADDLVDLSVDICLDRDNDIQTKKSAFEFLKTCILSMISTTEEHLGVQDDFKFTTKHVPIKKYFHISASSPKIDNFYQDEVNIEECKTTTRYEGEIAMFNKVLKSIFLFMSYAVKENLTDCIEFTKNLIRHFALTAIFNSYNYEEPSKFRINHDWFYEVLLDVYEEDCTETSPNVNVGDFILGLFTDYVYEICNDDPDLVIQFGIWERLQSRFTKFLYQPEWYKKCVGARGVLFLCENITPIWLVHYESDMLKGLFFSLKNQPVHMTPHTTQITIMAAESLVRACYNTPLLDFSLLFSNNFYEKVEYIQSAPSSTLAEGEHVVHAEKMGKDLVFKKRSLLALICSELSTPSSQIRKIAQSLLRLCSDMMNIPLSSIIDRFRPDATQSQKEQKDDGTGKKDISIITTSLEYSVLQLSTRDNNVPGQYISSQFTKALNLLRNDELYSKDTKDQKKLLNAKLVALKLLREAIVSKELRYNDKDTNKEQLKIMIETICKFLVATNKDVVTIAKTALLTYISQFRPPKDSLQQALRQLSTNLSKYTQLTLTFLQNAAFFLKVNSQIQTQLSKVASTLLEHLKKWADKQQIKHIANQKEKPIIAAEIVALFSIIPDTSEQLPALVKLVILLESVWSDEIKNSNPFIAPLAKYLNIYPEQAIKFLFETSGEQVCYALSTKRTLNFILEVLKSRKATDLRAYLFTHPNVIVTLLSSVNSIEFTETQAFASDPNNILILIGNILKLNPNVFITHREIFDQVLRIWSLYIQQLNQNPNAMDLSSDTTVSKGQYLTDTQRIRFTKKLLKLMIAYCNNNENEVDTLFNIVKVFGCGIVMDLNFVMEFFEIQVGCEYNLKRQEAILTKFLEEFKKEGTFQMKSDILKHVAIPIVRGIAKREKLSTDLLRRFIDEKVLFSPTFAHFTEKEKYSINTDLLQLLTLFVRYLPSTQLDVLKKEKNIFKFCYDNCCKDDITAAQCAFVLFAHLMSKLDLPPKLIQPVYIAFLKDCKKDSKSLVLPALDMVMQPVKKAELASEPKGKFPQWIRSTKQTLLEDVPSTHQLANIWTIFIRHADSFYDSRECFVYKMINALSKIGYSSINLENKKLYIQLADVIISWEERAARKKPYDEQEDDNEKKRKVDQTDLSDDGGSKKRKVDEETSLSVSAASSPIHEFTLKPQSRGIVLNFLIRMCIFVSQTRAEKPQALYKECIQILKRALHLWKDEPVSLAQAEKFFPNSEESSPTIGSFTLSCILELMNLLVEMNRDTIQLNAQFAKRLIPFLTTPYVDVNRNVCLFFKTLFKHFDPLKSNDNDVKEFYETIWNSVKETIGKYASKDLPQPAGNQTIDPCQHLVYGSFGHVLLLHLLCEHYSSDEIKQQYSRPVYSLLAKALKYSMNMTQESSWRDIYLGYIELCLSFLADGVHLDSIFKHYSQTVGIIIEKVDSFSYNILHLVVDIVLNWLRTNPSSEMQRSYTLQLDDGLQTMTLSRPYKVQSYLQKASLLAKLGSLSEQSQSSETVKNLGVENFNQFKREYFNVVAELYQQMDEISEVTYAKKIESCFMAGLKIESKELRDIKSRYISILNQKIEKTVLKRLQFVIDHQKWEPLSDRFWIKYALELLLECIEQEEKLTCHPKMAKFPPISTQPVMTSSAKGDSIAVSSSTALEKLRRVFESHESFLQSISSIKISNFIAPLKTLIRSNTNMVLKTWGEFFALAWNCLGNDDKPLLQIQMQKLVSIDYHSKQYTKYPNVIQALLLGVNNAVLNTKRDLSTFNYLSIHPETLKFLGKSFNAWSLTLPLLEEELRALFNTGSFDEKTEKVCHSLTELYRVLKEDDILCGIFRCCDITDHTKLVLSLEQRNNWCEAQEALKDLINAFHKGNIKKKVSHTELQLWEDHWIICSKKLQQWDELTKFSQSAPGTHGYFNLECLWKNGQWTQMKELFQKNQSLENQLMKFYHISYLIMQDKEAEAGDVFAISQQLALQRWCALPSFVCGNHTSMLQCFQQLYELNESASLLNDTKKPLSTHELKGFLTTWRDRLPNKYEDISVWNDIFTWRCHLLKKAIERFDQKDEFSHHRALLLNETIWSLHKFAKIARKQNFIEPALKMLAETGKLLPTLTSETSEVFVRIIEVIKSLMKDRRYNDVLDYIESDTIANTKIKTIQKMEILRLRGEVFSTCGRYDESYQTFAQSISYFPQEQKFISSVTSTPAWGKSFFQWALVLDKLFVEKWNSSTRHQRQKQNSTKHPTQSMTALEFAENCVAAYLLAIRYSGGATNHQTIQASGATVRQYIGRVLWLLSYDEPASSDKTKGGSNVDYPLHRVAEKCINDIPAWMWIPWQQQLFTMLHRRECEASIAKQLLKAVLYNFPQAAFHTFRSFVHDLRELLSGIAKKNQSTTTGTGSTNPSGTSESNTNTAAPLRGSSANIHVSIINKSGAISTSSDSNIPTGPNSVYLETFTKIRKKLDEIMHDGNKVLFSDLESMFKELTKYKSESEEELTKSLELMLDKAYTFNIYENSDSMVDEENEDELHHIPKELTDHAKRIADTYFADPPTQSSNPQQHQPVPKPQFILDCQSNVIADILPRKERREMAKSLKYVEKTMDAVGPRSLLDLTKNLKHWICYFRRKINLLPTEIGIENQKAKLLEHRTNLELEIPGQYELTSDREPFSERHEKILCLLPSVSMKGRKNKENERVIALRSVSGKVFKFFIQSTSNSEPLTLKTEEKVSSLIRHINRLLDKDRTARSHNNIHMEYPITITTNQRIRLVRKDYDFISLEDIFYDYCESIGKSIDTPLIKYWKEMDKACKTHINDFENKLNVYQTFVEQSDKIPDDILLNYIRSTCPSWSEFYSIRKTFGVQSGVYNIFSHLLHTKDRHPYKILISKNSGHMMQFDFRPNMNKASGIIQRDDPTPFRFTRNISQFLSQFGVEGYLLNTMSAIAYSLSENKDLFETLMQLFIRDELISYHNFNVDLLNNESSTPIGENRFLFNDELMRSCVQQNVDQVLEMVLELAPTIPTHLSCSPPQTLPVKKKTKKDATTSESSTSEVSTPSSITTPSTPSMASSSNTATTSVVATPSPFANATSLLDLPPLNYKVYELIQQASSAEKLCMKDPIYYPWF